MHPAQVKLSEHALLKNYLLDRAYDEMFAGPDELHPHYEPLFERFSSLPADELQRRRSEEHTSELQSLRHLVCRLLLEKKNIPDIMRHPRSPRGGAIRALDLPGC